MLQALASNAFERASPEEPDDELDSFFKVKGKKGAKSQKQVKRAKKVGRGAMDPRPFDAMGVAVPEDAQEAEALAKEILEDQKGIMEVWSRRGLKAWVWRG